MDCSRYQIPSLSSTNFLHFLLRQQRQQSTVSTRLNAKPSNQRLKTALNIGLEEIDSAKLSYGNNGFLTEFPQWFPHHAMPTPCL